MLNVKCQNSKLLKEIIILVSFLIPFVLFSKKTQAKIGWPWGQNSPGRIRQEIREELKEQFGLTGTPSPGAANQIRRQIREQVKEQFQQFKEKFSWLLPFGFNRVEIKAISGTTSPADLTVFKDDKIYTVKVTEKTLLLRKFGGKSSLDEFSEGDIISVRGRWVDEEKTILEARVIRNLSIQKRKGTFWGTIKLKEEDGKTFVLVTVQRGEQTVITDSKTKFLNRADKPISFADLKVGDRVRVSGLWDNKLNKITEVSRVKDWSIGPTSFPTATPSAD